ncbi:MAG: hypothetical protein JKY65_30245 [Planctomycetes bacterium]|nr:hypothetical protein [Planctomycetota bacterium]
MSELSLHGRLVREEFGPGALILETADGRRYALAGETSHLVPGQEVTVQGRIRDDLLGGAMTGAEVLEVRAPD